LTFSPLAWLKLQFFCHAGDTEIGGFGISAQDNLLYMEDFVTVRQQATAASVVFDDAAVADHFDQWVDAGLKPQQFARLRIHSHPGSSALPSNTDEETFDRVFGQNDWAVMAILSRSGQTYARLRHNAGPGSRQQLTWRVDWSAWPEEANLIGWQDLAQAWQEEFQNSIHPVPVTPFSFLGLGMGHPSHFQEYDGLGQFQDSFWEPGAASVSDAYQHPSQLQDYIAAQSHHLHDR
jgi:hypothetical protein